MRVLAGGGMGPCGRTFFGAAWRWAMRCRLCCALARVPATARRGVMSFSLSFFGFSSSTFVIIRVLVHRGLRDLSLAAWFSVVSFVCSLFGVSYTYIGVAPLGKIALCCSVGAVVVLVTYLMMTPVTMTIKRDSETLPDNTYSRRYCVILRL